jgi:hypothetical protein
MNTIRNEGMVLGIRGRLTVQSQERTMPIETAKKTHHVHTLVFSPTYRSATRIAERAIGVDIS